MYLLVEYNNNYREILDECKNRNIEAIVLFKLTLNGKDQIKRQLDYIRKNKHSIKNKTAVQVTIEKQENSSQGTINSLSQEFDLVIGLGGLNKINRFFLEDTSVDFLKDPQNTLFQNKTDFIHHLNTGLNQILCTFAKEKEIGFLFDLNILQSSSKAKVRDFGRMNANLKLARKYGVKSHISFIISNVNQIKDAKQMEKLPHLFDLSTKQIKESNTILEEKIKENAFKKSEGYISRGIEVK